MNTEDDSLVIFERAAVMLAEADTVQKCKEGKDLCFTAERFAKARKLSEESIQHARSYALEFERKLGEMLKEKPNPRNQRLGESDSPNLSIPTLEELGVTKDESKTAQAVANLPDEAFQAVKTGTISKKAAIKKNKKQAAGQSNGDKPEARRSAKPAKEHDRQAEVALLYDEGKTANEIALTLSLTPHQVANIIKSERTKRSAQANIDPELLSMTAQQKLALAIKQAKERLIAEWRVALGTEVRELLVNTIGPRHQREQDLARRVITSRQGIMNKAAYRKILACLHPDWVTDAFQKQRYEEAFNLFKEKEKLLLNEKESPTDFAGIPKTAAEWDEMKRQASASRKAKRPGNGGIQTK